MKMLHTSIIESRAELFFTTNHYYYQNFCECVVLLQQTILAVKVILVLIKMKFQIWRILLMLLLPKRKLWKTNSHLKIQESLD